MKKITLNIPERLYALGLLNQFKGGHRDLAFILQDIVPVGFTNEEKEKINLRDVLNDQGEPVSIAWDAEGAEDKKIEFHDEVVEYLKKVIEEKSKAGEFTVADRPVITILEKLNK